LQIEHQSAWVLVVSGVGALVITLLTVNFQAIKAALANPVKVITNGISNDEVLISNTS